MPIKTKIIKPMSIAFMISIGLPIKRNYNFTIVIKSFESNAHHYPSVVE